MARGPRVPITLGHKQTSLFFSIEKTLSDLSFSRSNWKLSKLYKTRKRFLNKDAGRCFQFSKEMDTNLSKITAELEKEQLAGRKMLKEKKHFSHYRKFPNNVLGLVPLWNQLTSLVMASLTSSLWTSCWEWTANTWNHLQVFYLLKFSWILFG